MQVFSDELIVLVCLTVRSKLAIDYLMEELLWGESAPELVFPPEDISVCLFLWHVVCIAMYM